MMFWTIAAGFAAPGLAMAGLAAALLPLIIHLLLRRRRQPVEWAAMDLLRRAVERRRRQLRLERLLLLAIRMAAIALLGAALARPYLEGSSSESGGRSVWIVLDDGVATGVVGEDGSTAFESIASRTASWVEGRPGGDEIGVALASSPPRILIEPTADHRRIAERIQALQPRYAGSDFDGALELVSVRLAESPTTRPLVMIASEFRRGSLAEVSIADGGGGGSAIAAIEDIERIVFEPAVEPIDNVQIVSVRPGRPPAGGGLAPIAIELARQGLLKAQTTRLSLSGPVLDTAIERDVRWRSGESTTSIELLVEVPMVDSAVDSRVLIEVSVPPDAQAADDRRYALLDARPRIRVGVAGDDRDSEQWLSRAISPSAEVPIDIVSIEPALIDAATTRLLDALILPRPDLIPASSWSTVGGMIERGCVVMVAPPSTGGGIAWLDRLAEIVPGRTWSFGAGSAIVEAEDGRRIDSSSIHPTWLGMIAAEFEELSDPVAIDRRLEIVGGVPESEIVIRSVDGAPIVLASTDRSGGSLILFAVAPDLEWSDLPVRPLMVPLVQELLREGLVRGRAGDMGTIGTRSSPSFASASVVSTPSGTRLAVRDRAVESPVDEIGPHGILDAAGVRIGTFVANVDAPAAATDPVDRETILAMLEPSGTWAFEDEMSEVAGIGSVDSGDSSFSFWMLAGVVALLVAEALLSRRFSHAGTVGDVSTKTPDFLTAFGVGETGRTTTRSTS